jgi:hypothetical protein
LASFDLLWNVQFLLGLPIVLPLLQSIHNLIKFNLLKEVFTCGYVATPKVCQGEIYVLYMDVNIKVKFDAFNGYKSLLDIKYESIVMHCVIDLNIGVEHLIYLMWTNNIYGQLT